MELHEILPTLHRRFMSAVARVVLAFGAIGVLLSIGLFSVGKMPAELVRQNYDSVVFARQMSTALNACRFPEQHAQQTPAQWRDVFEQALMRAGGNETEPGEKAAVSAIAESWKHFALTRDDAAYTQVRADIETLVNLNERGIRLRLDSGRWWRDGLFLAGLLIFLACTVWAFFQSDAIADRLAHPLRRAAEVLQARPSLRNPLRLPDPQTLEVRILFDEFARLWKRLGEVDTVNVNRLIAEKDKLAVILESAEDAVLMLGPAGLVEHASSRMLELLALPVDEVLNRPWDDLPSGGANYMALRESLTNTLQGSRDMALRVADRNGGEDEERWFTARRRLLPNSRGQVYLLTEITEKKRRDALRSEMMDWISHELKTPVQSLELASDLLSRRPEIKVDDDMAELAATIRQDTVRLRTVSAQFIDIARMSPQALDLRPEPADLARDVDEWLKPFRLAAREEGVTLDLDVLNALPTVVLDRERFAWVLSNLVSNALRAVPGGARIGVTLAQEAGGDIALRVEDNGPGIDAELSARLFRPFSHGRMAGSRLGLTGLGLAISKAIVEAHGGSIAYAPAEQGGSVFTVRLPRSTQPVVLNGV